MKTVTVAFLSLMLAGTAMSQDLVSDPAQNVFLNYGEEKLLYPNPEYRLGSSDWQYELMTTSEWMLGRTGYSSSKQYLSDSDDLYNLRPSFDFEIFGLEGTLYLTENKDEFFLWEYHF